MRGVVISAALTPAKCSVSRRTNSSALRRDLRLLTRLGYQAYLFKACPDGAQRLAILEQLQAIAARYAREQDGVLGEFLVQAGLGH